MIVSARRPERPAVSKVVSIPAPVGGWNARDALPDQEPTDAVSLENWVPGTTRCELRKGHTQFATGISGQVETVMGLAGLSTNKLLAAAGSNIYDITAGGAVGAAEQSGLTLGRWQHINYANISGNYLYMVNGSDAPRYWNGSAWTNAAITGLTIANLIHINEHKNRIWFVEKNTLNAWYLDVGSIAGAATKFPLEGVAQRGGYLMAMATWTVDAGYGVDDMAVFVTSAGEVIVYKGTDPDTADTWALVGIWQLGSPVGRRCFCKFAGDLALITQDGVVPLSGALQSSRLNPRVALTDKIQKAISEAIGSYGTNFGWQVLPFPKANLLIVNVPVQEGDNQQQYVMNTINKSWCNFTGWEANCWELWQNDIYFGGNGFVGKAWNGTSDNGSDIQANGLQSFHYFGVPGRLKRFTMMRPTLQTNGTPSILASINTDFDVSDPTAALTFTGTNAGIWDSGVWDTALWGASQGVANSWQGASGVGYAGAPRLKAACHGLDLAWVSTDVVFEPGAVL